MPRFAANLTMLFNELHFLERFAAARAAGFKGVEYLFPYAYGKAELAERLERCGLVQVLHNLPPGDWDRGERGIACHPAREREFQDGVGRAIEYAQTLGCRRLNCLAGIAPAGADRDAGALRKAGIRLLVEPVNTFDIPGFYLSRTAQALELIDETGSDNLFLQYDIYHAQRMEGEIAGTIARALPRIAHIQLADNPGRHEPGTGEINYDWLQRQIDRLGYDGWIGCEYKPAGATRAGLGWIAALDGSH